MSEGAQDYENDEVVGTVLDEENNNYSISHIGGRNSNTSFHTISNHPIINNNGTDTN